MAEEEQATFTLTLRDEISRTAQHAGGSLEALRKRLGQGQAALGEMNKALGRMKAGGLGASGAADHLRSKIDAQKKALASAQAAAVGLGESFKQADKPADTFGQRMAKQPGLTGALVSRWLAFREALKTTEGRLALGINLFAGLAGASIAMATAIGVGAVALARFGIAHADARRNELLHLEALTRMRTFMGGAAGTAGELQAAIDRVSAGSALGRGELTGYAEQLYRMGLRGDNLSQALEGTAIAASTVGDAYARRFAGMAAGAAHAGGSVRRLADDIRGRLGGVAARQAIGLDAQMTRLREGIGSIFDSVDIEPLLRGMNEVTSLFARGRVVSEAWGRVLGVVFRPFIGGAEGAGVTLRSLIIRFTTGVVRAATSVLWIVASLRRVDEQLGVTRALSASAFGVVGSHVVAASATIDGLIEALGRASLMAGATATVLRDRWESARASFTGWTGIGAQLVDGLVTGIRSGYDRVTSTVRGLAAAASSALTDALEIRSPSRVFASFGREIPRGLAAGVDEGTGEATGAVGRLAGRSRASFDEAPTGGAVSSATSSATSIGPFYFEMHGDSNRDDLEEWLTSLFERLGLVAGVAT